MEQKKNAQKSRKKLFCLQEPSLIYGSSVIHDPSQQVTFSLQVPKDMNSKSVPRNHAVDPGAGYDPRNVSLTREIISGI
jgi:hypothetical protein